MVSWPTYKVHHRDAENAEEAQRVSQKTAELLFEDLALCLRVFLALRVQLNFYPHAVLQIA